MSSHKLEKKIIDHIAIIMDGNGRWAQNNDVPKKKGHEAGVKNCIYICKNLNKIKYKIGEISFYVFSTENWRRNPKEIKNLFDLISEFYLQFQTIANENKLSIKHCGSRKRLSRKIVKIIDEVTFKTKSNRGTKINLMFNYGSRQELHDAIEKIIDSTNKKINIRDNLYLSNSKDPDLIIRTGGEQRLSNFMLWQSAYSELYFTKILWPNFKIKHLTKAIQTFFIRNRKYGK